MHGDARESGYCSRTKVSRGDPCWKRVLGAWGRPACDTYQEVVRRACRLAAGGPAEGVSLSFMSRV